MKFDMGRAWSDTVDMISKNFGLIATVLGLFFFLPAFASVLLFPGLSAQPPEPPVGAEPDVVLEAMRDYFVGIAANYWWVFLVIIVLQYAGSIALLALFRKDRKPTVGEALKAGFAGTPTYIAILILTSIAYMLIIAVPVLLGAAISPILGALLILPALIAVVYVGVKWSLAAAVIGMEGQLNPITVLQRSWRLTKGNSIMIFLFLLVLAIIALLIYFVVVLSLSAIFIAMGDSVAVIGAGLLEGVASAALTGFFLVVIGAIYLQLSAGPAEKEVETFE